MMDWVIFYKIGEAFNVLYQIGDGFNGKGDGYFELLHFDYDLNHYKVCDIWISN